MGRFVVVTGVGTGIGKTHLGVALVLAARACGVSVAGYKPIESGLDGATAGDADALREASSFQVEPAPLYGFAPPVSPHLAAEWAGSTIALERIESAVAEARAKVELVVVELAGGLFTPLSASDDNASLLLALAPDHTVLVAEDALGVLHHVRASRLAASARGVGPMHLALVCPRSPDASTGHNEATLASSFASTTYVPRLAAVPDLARSEPVRVLLDRVLR